MYSMEQWSKDQDLKPALFEAVESGIIEKLKDSLQPIRNEDNIFISGGAYDLNESGNTYSTFYLFNGTWYFLGNINNNDEIILTQINQLKEMNLSVKWWFQSTYDKSPWVYCKKHSDLSLDDLISIVLGYCLIEPKLKAVRLYLSKYANKEDHIELIFPKGTRAKTKEAAITEAIKRNYGNIEQVYIMKEKTTGKSYSITLAKKPKSYNYNPYFSKYL